MMKMRLLPTKDQEKKLLVMTDQARWYYNMCVNLTSLKYGNSNLDDAFKDGLSDIFFRDEVVRRYSYEEKILDDQERSESQIVRSFIGPKLIEKDIVIFDLLDEDTKNYITEEMKGNEFTIPEWWSEGRVHNRVVRGAISKYVSSLNSALSNRRNGHQSKENPLKMNFISRKRYYQFISFEDSSYPKEIDKVKSVYFYTDKDRKRRTMDLSEIKSESGKNGGMEIIYDSLKKKWFLHYPVPATYYPSSSLRNRESQSDSPLRADSVVSLDPGIRTFMTGYDPVNQNIIEVGRGKAKRIARYLLLKDNTEVKKHKEYLQRKIRHLVDDLHWKTISFLVSNYKNILLPEFPVSEMVKGKKIARIVKRNMLSYRFYEFKQRLSWKCKMVGCNLYIVDESYTSKTCGGCGELNRKLGGKSIFSCVHCGFCMGRDENGARNILLKNLRSGSDGGRSIIDFSPLKK